MHRKDFESLHWHTAVRWQKVQNFRADLEPVALLLLTDVIREEAPDTLKFFDSQEVDLKVISGDDPVTVSAIAKRAGLKNAESYVDATTLETEEDLEEAVSKYSVFGRVTPAAEKRNGTGSSETGTYRCHDRRWRQRCSCSQRSRLQYCHGTGK